MLKNRLFDALAFAFCVAVLTCLLLTVGGCCLFEKSRVEARADYHVFAEDCTVSIVAVGYNE